MSDAQQEPSMEEILASIRKIISEDSEEEPTEEQAAAGEDVEPEPAPEPEPEPEEEPLQLDEEVEEEPLELADEVEQEPPEQAEEPQADEEELPEIEFLDDEPEPESEPLREPEPVLSPLAMAGFDEEQQDDRLISPPTEAAGAAAFLALERSIRMGQTGDTLEDVVKGLLKPMLRHWLDENLPDMVERLVRAEIEKMAGGARRRGDDDSW